MLSIKALLIIARFCNTVLEISLFEPCKVRSVTEYVIVLYIYTCISFHTIVDESESQALMINLSLISDTYFLDSEITTVYI